MTPQQIAHYRITAKLGEGGMGAVYRATDNKLKREVALKVLPDAFASDPERMARFQREAEVLASLNHSNIAQIYGVEDRALVMELVEGESPKGPMPFDGAWEIASQIAAGLEYAHEKGIVHRDLKPANIKITPDGVVKLLDFGLAKAFTGRATASGNVENSPTLTLGATQLGVILGTAAYMAPEQAKGKAVDKRADIWSFGVVLYELLTGERLFNGDDVSDTLAQVLMKQPDLDRAPFQARRLLGECLQKDPKERLRDIGDAKRQVLEAPAQKFTAIAPQTSSHRNTLVALGIATVAMLAVATLSAIHFREKPPETPVFRTSILPPEDASGFSFDPNTGGTAISPDGRLLAFVANVKGKSSLYIRALDSLAARALPGTEGAGRPFWSPDSRNIGFQADGKLKRIGVNEGAPRVICDLQLARGATWNADGVIVFSARPSNALNRVAASGGTPQPVTVVDETETFHYWPQFLPDGKHFLYLARARDLTKGAVYVASLDNKPEEKRRVKLVDSELGAVYAPNPATPGKGHLFWVQGQNLMAQAFDPVTFRLSGEAAPIADSIGETQSDGYADLSASQTGILAYGNARQTSYKLTWIDRSGKRSAPLSAVAAGSFRISPDGNRVIVPRAAPRLDLWLVDLLRSTETRFTFSGGVGPIWSPDGRDILFATPGGLFRKPASGAGDAVALLKATGTARPLDWSDDGKWLLYSQVEDAGFAIRAISMETGTTAKPFVFLKTAGLVNARFSPTIGGQRFVAYVSLESGQAQVYIQDFPDKRGKWQVSTTSGGLPAWNRNGKELFYETLDGKMMRVDVKVSGAALTLGQPELMFDLTSNMPFDASPDAKRFLVPLPQEQGSGHDSITIVQNWPAALGK